MENTSVLILGAGELGMPIIRNISKKAKNYNNITVTVLLREATINSEDPDKKKNVREIRELGVELLAGDLSATSSELIDIFRNYDAIVSCTGYGTGAGGFQLKLANAILMPVSKDIFPGSSEWTLK
ncbi:NmrA family NAD(P)-binding protein [Epilithonimonas sp. JDS]|uniref:NmrA family NAD(P)-binding protein n=1 Tax=Epilithonimonas sp. JDS TaxID=2902797 RepID=UPI0021D42CA4|nr:NmrA family NAD(P)-binding protein [Epilithonimonas sp. JDS]